MGCLNCEMEQTLLKRLKLKTEQFNARFCLILLYYPKPQKVVAKNKCNVRATKYQRDKLLKHHTVFVGIPQIKLILVLWPSYRFKQPLTPTAAGEIKSTALNYGDFHHHYLIKQRHSFCQAQCYSHFLVTQCYIC